MNSIQLEKLTKIDQSLAEKLFCRGFQVFKTDDACTMAMPVLSEKDFFITDVSQSDSELIPVLDDNGSIHVDFESSQDLDLGTFAAGPGIDINDPALLHALSTTLKSDLNRELGFYLEIDISFEYETCFESQFVRDSIENIRDFSDFDSCKDYFSTKIPDRYFSEGLKFLSGHTDIETSFSSFNNYIDNRFINHVKENAPNQNIDENIRCDLSFVQNRSDMVQLIRRCKDFETIYKNAAANFSPGSHLHRLNLNKSQLFENTGQILENCLTKQMTYSQSDWQSFLNLGTKGYHIDEFDPQYPHVVKIDDFEKLLEDGHHFSHPDTQRADAILDGFPGNIILDTKGDYFFIPDEQFLKTEMPLDISNFKKMDLRDFVLINIETSGLRPEIQNELLKVRDLSDLDSLRSGFEDDIAAAKDSLKANIETADKELLISDINHKTDALRFIDDAVLNSYVESNSMTLDEWNDALRQADGGKTVELQHYISVDLNRLESLDNSRVYVSDDLIISLDRMECIALTDNRAYFDLDPLTYFHIVNTKVIENYGLADSLSKNGMVIINNHCIDFLKENGLLQEVDKNFFDGLDRCSLQGKGVILDTCYATDGNFVLYDEHYFFDELYPELQNPESMENECPFDMDEIAGMD